MRFERDRAGDPPWNGRPRHWSGRHNDHPITGFYGDPPRPVIVGKHEQCPSEWRVRRGYYQGIHPCVKPVRHDGDHIFRVQRLDKRA